MGGGPSAGTARFTCWRLAGPVKIAETGIVAGFPVIAKGSLRFLI
jgi:hypothetical protein